jgi:hypothetical protein
MTFWLSKASGSCSSHPSPTGQAAGERFWPRRHQCTVDVGPPTTKQTMLAQTAAIVDWKIIRTVNPSPI